MYYELVDKLVVRKIKKDFKQNKIFLSDEARIMATRVADVGHVGVMLSLEDIMDKYLEIPIRDLFEIFPPDQHNRPLYDLLNNLRSIYAPYAEFIINFTVTVITTLSSIIVGAIISMMF